jgi:hypothetical protein
MELPHDGSRRRDLAASAQRLCAGSEIAKIGANRHLISVESGR